MYEGNEALFNLPASFIIANAGNENEGEVRHALGEIISVVDYRGLGNDNACYGRKLIYDPMSTSNVWGDAHSVNSEPLSKDRIGGFALALDVLDGSSGRQCPY